MQSFSIPQPTMMPLPKLPVRPKLARNWTSRSSRLSINAWRTSPIISTNNRKFASNILSQMNTKAAGLLWKFPARSKNICHRRNHRSDWWLQNKNKRYNKSFNIVGWIICKKWLFSFFWGCNLLFVCYIRISYYGGLLSFLVVRGYLTTVIFQQNASKPTR